MKIPVQMIETDDDFFDVAYDSVIRESSNHLSVVDDACGDVYFARLERGFYDEPFNNSPVGKNKVEATDSPSILDRRTSHDLPTVELRSDNPLAVQDDRPSPTPVPIHSQPTGAGCQAVYFQFGQLMEHGS